ncbi:MAG: hypothetical protein KKA73_05465 [Chloroflexi bacterium]|nr:hypothetical protein [Chloroflexota bacterium]
MTSATLPPQLPAITLHGTVLKPPHRQAGLWHITLSPDGQSRFAVVSAHSLAHLCAGDPVTVSGVLRSRQQRVSLRQAVTRLLRGHRATRALAPTVAALIPDHLFVSQGIVEVLADAVTTGASGLPDAPPPGR